MNLNNVLPHQVQELKTFKYKTELQTMKNVLNMPVESLNLTKLWLAHLNREHTTETKQSTEQLRLKGNEAFKSRQLLLAANQYTAAICAAAAQKEALALAHANRAQVLMEFGYYAQAYDDCVCALENGYAEKLKHKVILRQATCAAKLGKLQLLQTHLVELNEFTLNINCRNELERLQEAEKQLVAGNTQNEELNTQETSNVTNKSEVVIEHNMRCLKSNVSITKDEIIFQDQAQCLVTAGDTAKCAYCLNTLYIPFPCLAGYAHVHYCSIKCRKRDADMHKYECAGYCMQLFRHVGIAHLAFRSVLEGLPTIINLLSSYQDPESIWQALLSLKKAETAYASTLQLQSRFAANYTEDIKYYALVVYAILMYLSNYTDYFDNICSELKASRSDWQLIVGALILRHIGQFLINAHEVSTLLPVTKINQCVLLQPNIWCGPIRLKCGHLHEFSSFDGVAAANFPYLSLANHACAPSFQTSFNRRNVSTFAVKNITSNAELFNCYTLTYRHTAQSERMKDIQLHNFKCACEVCRLPNPDVYFVSISFYFC